MAPSEPEPPDQALKLDAKNILDFVADQSRRDREYFDILLKRFTLLAGVFLAVFFWFGFKNLQSVQEVQEDAKRKMQAAVERELAADKIQEQISANLKKLTDTKLQGAIDRAVATELEKPEFRTFIGDSIKRELSSRMAPRLLTEAQKRAIAASLRIAPGSRVTVRTGSLPEQQNYARNLNLAIKGSASWKDHVSYAEPGTWEGLTNNTNLLLDGIVVVVDDIAHPTDAARLLVSALKSAGIASALGVCGCDDPPKPPDIWLYVGEKKY